MKSPKKKPKFESDGRKELEQIRWRLGLTQREFAIGVGLKPSTYEGYERGLHKLPNSVLVNARALEDSSAAPVPEANCDHRPVSQDPDGVTGNGGNDSTETDKASYWAETRRECRAFRTENYTKPARILMTLRDHVYMTATFYFTLKQVAVALNAPFGVEIGGVDYAFVGSFFLICVLFVSVLQDLPLLKGTRHLVLRG